MRPIADNVGPQRLCVASQRLRGLRTRSDEGGSPARLQHCECALRHVTANRVERGIASRRSFCEVLCWPGRVKWPKPGHSATPPTSSYCLSTSCPYLRLSTSFPSSSSLLPDYPST